jgi:hemoglobin/transferrin/lactoferrin receptor protein
MQKIIYFLVLALSISASAQENQTYKQVQDTLPPPAPSSISPSVSPPREGQGEAVGEALGGVVISASRTAELRKEVPQQIRVIGRAEIQNTNASTTADLLQTTGAAAVQKSQLGGGSPVLRGFEANRVLLVVDGVRQNNLIFRSGHLQNILTLDANAADRIEILYGSGALMYGSDALGGVVNIYTAQPASPDPSRGGETDGKNAQTLPPSALTTSSPHSSGGAGGGFSAFTRYASAANEATINAALKFNKNKWGSVTMFTASQFSDQRKGANNLFGYAGFGDCTKYVERINGTDSIIQNTDPNIQRNTGYSQLDVLQKVKYQATATQSHTLNLQLSTSTNVPRYDRLQTFSSGKPKFAEWYYGPQQRFMAAYHYQNTHKNIAFDVLRLTPAYQKVQESRISRGYRKAIGTQQIEDVQVFSLNADIFKQIKQHEIRYGAEFTQQGNVSTASPSPSQGGGTAQYGIDKLQLTLFQPTTSPPLGGQGGASRYPNANMTTTALYFTDAVEIPIKKYSRPTTNISSAHPSVSPPREGQGEASALILRGGLRFTDNSLSANFTNFALKGDANFAQAKQENTSLDGSFGAVYLFENGFRLAANIATGFRAPNVDDLGKTFEQTNGTIILPNPKLQPERTLQKEITIERISNTGFNIALTAFHTNLNQAIAVKPLQYNGADSVTYNGARYLAVANVNLAQAELYGASLSIKTPIIGRLSANTNLTYTHGYDLTNGAPLDHIPPLYGNFNLKYQAQKWSAEAYTIFNGWKHIWDYSPTGEDNPDKATPDGTFAWYTLNMRCNYCFTKKINLQLAAENLLDANYRTFASGISGAGRNIIATLRFTDL